MNLVLVYLGNPVPRYLERNLEYLHSTFPEEKIWLISDLPSNRKCADRAQINFFLCENPRMNWSDLYESMENKKNYRSGFWFNTKARLLVLEEFMHINYSDSVLHIEADIWLSPKFPMRKIAMIEKDFAFPITSMNSGIASTLYLRDSEASSKLVSKVIEVSKTNPLATDVDILGQLRKSFPTSVELLPNSLPIDHKIEPDSQDELLSLMSSNFHKFGGVFDASTFGVHLSGLDPRNRYGIRELYNPMLHHAIDITSYTFLLEDGFPFVIYKELEFPIFSLHIHSKDKRFFVVHKWQKILARRILKRRSRPRFEYSILGLFGFISDYYHLLVQYFIRKIMK
jgi:hypothetical protein